MVGDNKEDVNADSAEFKKGVEAGLNSAEDTKNWKAGNELGQELREEGETKGPIGGHPDSAPPTPLFMKSSSEGRKGADQDEKDWMGE
jgi:hypothetical protein